MAIQIPTGLEERIRQKVESGQYDDPSAVIRAATRLLDSRDQRLEHLRALVAEGVASIERGDVSEWTPELMARIDQEAGEQLHKGIPADPDACP